MVIVNTKSTNYIRSEVTGIIYGSNEYGSWRAFIFEGLGHRYYGPTVIYHNNIKYWFFKNKLIGEFTKTSFFNQKEFIKKINRQWLL